MRGALIAFAAGALLLVPAAVGLAPGTREKMDEALRLEVRALNLYQGNPDDPEIDELINRSIQLLDELPTLNPRNPLEGPDHTVGTAMSADKRFLREKDNRNAAVHDLTAAIIMKQLAIDDAVALEWWYKEQSEKAAKRTRVSAPRCSRALAAFTPSGCWHLDTWDINVDADAKRARCWFTGPNGKRLLPDRPLFPGTYEQTSCRLTNRYVRVDGVRKRVVHAELRITVPEGVKAGGSKAVLVRAYWQ